jgi:hypothetical protein
MLPTENAKASLAGRGFAASHRRRHEHASFTPPRLRRQYLIEQAEGHFNIPGAHHADHPGRRRKTVEELRDSLEFYKLADRAEPGKHMRRWHP